jgi:fucose permease
MLGSPAAQLLDVLNSHFQQVFGITKLQSTLLQLAYFVSEYSTAIVDQV